MSQRMKTNIRRIDPAYLPLFLDTTIEIYTDMETVIILIQGSDRGTSAGLLAGLVGSGVTTVGM